MPATTSTSMMMIEVRTVSSTAASVCGLVMALPGATLRGLGDRRGSRDEDDDVR